MQIRLRSGRTQVRRSDMSGCRSPLPCLSGSSGASARKRPWPSARRNRWIAIPGHAIFLAGCGVVIVPSERTDHCGPRRKYPVLMSLFVLLALSSLLVLLWYLPAHLLRRRAEWQLAELCRTRRAIALTYDDGPGEQLTPDLAMLLQQRKAPATFFAIGAEVTRRPGTLALLVRNGHEIGNHTRRHRNAWKSAPWTPILDIRSGQRDLAAVDVAPALFARHSERPRSAA